MAKEYKYPYIPKEYYPAVMYACKKIRETHWFNKSIDWAYSAYWRPENPISKEKLAEYVSQRAGAGHKKRNSQPMKYFIVRRHEYQAEFWTDNYSYFVKGARRLENLEDRLIEHQSNINSRNDYGGSYARIVTFKVCGVEIPSKKLAEKITDELNGDKKATEGDINEAETHVRRIVAKRVEEVTK